jgi:DNA processing protein
VYIFSLPQPAKQKPISDVSLKLMEERAAWLAWAQVPGIGPISLQRLQQRFGRLAVAWAAPLDQIQTVSGIGPSVLSAIATHRSSLEPETFLATHSQSNPTFWTPADDDYPRLLREIPDPPAVLYYRGNAQLLDPQGQAPAVAIVGTRDPSDYAKRWTHKLAKVLAQNGITVISGMAEGIDTHAHLGCLEGKGHTIAALGTGTDIAYPPRNAALHQQLLAQGLVLSEYPAGTPPNRANFPRRNRIIAALGRATLVMEAPQRSGALITAYLANDYGRDVYVLPGTLDNPRALGCLALMTKGAQLILGEGHLLELLGTIPALDRAQPASAPAKMPPLLSPELQTVFDHLQSLGQTTDPAAISFDQLVQVCQQPASHLSGALLRLELLGLVTQLPGMRYAIVP